METKVKKKQSSCVHLLFVYVLQNSTQSIRPWNTNSLIAYCHNLVDVSHQKTVLLRGITRTLSLINNPCRALGSLVISNSFFYLRGWSGLGLELSGKLISWPGEVVLGGGGREGWQV